jgi:nucleoside-diphosphate-sugar epimerase
MRLFVFGLGYSAGAALRRLRPAGAVGTRRVPGRTEGADELASRVAFDGHDASALPLDGTTHLLVSIPPEATGTDPVLAAAAGRLAGLGTLRSVVYLSTVGVYGDHGGDWVDELSPCRPASRRSVARLAAEDSWRDFSARTGLPVAILRLSGIYGPGRNALCSLADGSARRLVKPGQVFNRVHVDDIAAAVAAAFGREANGVFNVTDDEPAPPQDVVAYAAALMGVEPPPEQDFATAELTPMARSFYGENKRVRNDRSKMVLGLAYAYPDYRAGLSALWAGSWRG